MATILIVDDRPTNRQFLLTLLGYGGHRLLEAANGAEALERVRAERPDLVITDILMPTMDGYEFVAHLRADPDLAPMPESAVLLAWLEQRGVSCFTAAPGRAPEAYDRIVALKRELGLAEAIHDSAVNPMAFFRLP